MKINFLVIAILGAMLSSCGSSSRITAKDVSVAPVTGSQISINKPVVFSYTTASTVDSVVLVLDSQRYSFDLSSRSVSSPNITAYRELNYSVVFYNSAGSYVYNGLLKCLPKSPSYVDVVVERKLPHPDNSHTQGLCIDGDVLYESSGEYGKSYLRSLDLKSLKELNRVRIGDRYFAEGIAIIGQELFMLTWQEQQVFVYDKSTLKLLRTMPIKLEGWGLTTDGQYLYLSDGSEYIYTLNPENLSVLEKRMVVTNNGAINYLNELEWIDGYLYANVFTTDYIIKINPVNGAVETIYYAKGLWSMLPENNSEDVLNGIAYDKRTAKVYITGKKWDNIYEVKLP